MEFPPRAGEGGDGGDDEAVSASGRPSRRVQFQSGSGGGYYFRMDVRPTTTVQEVQAMVAKDANDAYAAEKAAANAAAGNGLLIQGGRREPMEAVLALDGFDGTTTSRKGSSKESGAGTLSWAPLQPDRTFDAGIFENQKSLRAFLVLLRN